MSEAPHSTSASPQLLLWFDVSLYCVNRGVASNRADSIGWMFLLITVRRALIAYDNKYKQIQFQRFGIWCFLPNNA